MSTSTETAQLRREIYLQSLLLLSELVGPSFNPNTIYIPVRGERNGMSGQLEYTAAMACIPVGPSFEPVVQGAVADSYAGALANLLETVAEAMGAGGVLHSKYFFAQDAAAGEVGVPVGGGLVNGRVATMFGAQPQPQPEPQPQQQDGSGA
jgi:hypothetical protein